MRNFFERMNERTRRFMAGRYGTDELSKFLLGVTLVVLFLSLFTGAGLLYVLALVGLGISYYRMLSRDFAKRREENSRYLTWTSKIRKTARVQKRRFDERKEYRYFRCPGCGQDVRVPKGKGHIRITCPKCGNQFDRTV